MDRQRGIALLNALVLVAAISAVASTLMLRAENSRSNLSVMRDSDQAMMYLDAAELLVEPVLQGDWERDQTIDHLRESWAFETFDADIDRGTITGKVQDLQGLFNINCLSNMDDEHALSGFERLMRSLDLPLLLARDIARFVRAEGPADLEAYMARDVPLRPPRGQIKTVEELRLVKGMTAAAFERLYPYVSTLDDCVAINVNTAPRAVLAALMPKATPGGLDKLMEDRARLPFADPGDFDERARKLILDNVIEEALFPDSGPSVKSNWFRVTFIARLDETVAARQLIVKRLDSIGEIELVNRMAVLP